MLHVQRVHKIHKKALTLDILINKKTLMNHLLKD